MLGNKLPFSGPRSKALLAGYDHQAQGCDFRHPLRVFPAEPDVWKVTVSWEHDVTSGYGQSLREAHQGLIDVVVLR
jgi:hypothetical protein